MKTISLDGRWVLSAGAGAETAGAENTDVETTGTGSARRLPKGIDARVPGCVHTDLLRAGLIPDPFDADNESALAWIGRTDWVYSRTFDVGDVQQHARWELVADGLDTFASVWLNGHEVGHTQNQFRSYRFDILPFLRSTGNELRVVFSAPVTRAESLQRLHGALPHVNRHPYNQTRKSASNFGWDWGIDVATSGIWKSMRVEGWSDLRLAAVRPLVDLEDGVGVVDVHVDLEWADPQPADPERADPERTGAAEPAVIDVELRSPDGELVARRALEATPGCGSVTRRIRVSGPQLWWPRGHGAQPLYTVRLRVERTRQEWSGRIGIRSVRLDTNPDRDGTCFRLVVNGEPIFVRGANWIPDHAFVTEVDGDRYRRRIRDAVEANMNLLRVWGGGIYESHDFYDVCDELGVLVWQDFMFACAAYSEAPWFAAEVDAEAREAVTRLARHPSLVLWNGCNENIVAFAEWGWRDGLQGRPWGDRYYRELLPRIVADLDGTRPYSPGSPFSYDDYLSPNDANHGTMHIWDVWNERDWRDYATHRPRFVSEFGFQGPPAWSTLTRVVHDSPQDPFGRDMLVHQKAERGNDKLQWGMRGHLAAPGSFDDWHWATQLNQAMAVRFAVEHFRSLGARLTGTIVWQLNDNWPVVSWSAVDFDEHRKPVWYVLRDAYSPRLVTVGAVHPGHADRAAHAVHAANADREALEIVLANDDPSAWRGEVSIQRTTFAGDVQASASVPLAVEPRAHARAVIPESVLEGWDAAREVLVIDAPGFGRAVHHGAEVVDQLLDADPLLVEPREIEGGWILRVTARSLARDVTILADRVHPSLTVDDGMRTLLAGETVEFHVHGHGQGTDADAVTSPLVVRHANSFRGRIS